MKLLNSAKARNVSLISAQQLLTWLDGRNSSSFGNPTWNGTQLGFSITVGAGANNLFAMVPNQTPRGHLGSLTINGSPVAFTIETIKGRSYACSAPRTETPWRHIPPDAKSAQPGVGQTHYTVKKSSQLLTTLLLSAPQYSALPETFDLNPGVSAISSVRNRVI